MENFTLKIVFRGSRSKFYNRVVKLASLFDNFIQEDVNVVIITSKELFEKWEFFNLIFWKVVDWKGSILEYDGMQYHSHTDKTRIFYALQHAHVVHICDQIQRIKEIQELYPVVVTQKEYTLMFN